MRNTKSNPYRFDWSHGIAIKEDSNNKWVQLSDYQKLLDEIEKLKSQIPPTTIYGR